MLGILALAALQAADVSVAAPAPTSIESPDGFRVGTDTLATVTAKLGKPFTVVRNSDGTEIAVYASNRTRVKGSTFIPIVGAFAGGAHVKISTKTFTFGSDGILKSFTSSDTDTNCNTSLTGGHCS